MPTPPTPPIDHPIGAAGRHVVLLGMMGTGKTTLGGLLATRLGRPHRDSDEAIRADAGMDGRRVAAESGVAALHAREVEVLHAHLRSPDPAVVSAAASVVDDPEGRAALSGRAICLWLDGPTDVLLARLAAGTHRRPMEPEEFDTAMARRAPHFADLSIARLDAERSAHALLEDALMALAQVGISPGR